MEDWRKSLRITKETEIKIRLMSTTFSCSFLFGKKVPWNTHLQNHTNPILSVVIAVQIQHSYLQCRVCMGLYGLYICTSALSDKENHYLTCSLALNVKHFLQLNFSPLSTTFFCSLLYLILLLYLSCGFLLTNDSVNVSSMTSLPPLGNNFRTPASFQLFIDLNPQRNLKKIKAINAFYQLIGVPGLE